METVKNTKVAMPEAIVLYLKTKMKEEKGEYATVGEYIVHRLDELAIIESENVKLAKKNEDLINACEQAIKERRQASIQVSASEARVSSLQTEIKSEIQARRNLAIELRNFEDKYETLQKANETKDIELRKLRSEKITAENRLQVVEAENELNKKILDYKRTFIGRIKNLFL